MQVQFSLLLWQLKILINDEQCVRSYHIQYLPNYYTRTPKTCLSISMFFAWLWFTTQASHIRNTERYGSASILKLRFGRQLHLGSPCSRLGSQACFQTAGLAESMAACQTARLVESLAACQTARLVESLAACLTARLVESLTACLTARLVESLAACLAARLTASLAAWGT